MGLRLVNQWLWDFWVVDDGHNYHLFYLQAPRSLIDGSLRHWNTSIGHAISRDLIHWTVLPDALKVGLPGEWDDYGTWTGSIIKCKDTWYLLYTGIKKLESGLIQRIGQATSDDLLHWTKHPDNPVLCADPKWYELFDPTLWHDQAWRDPWVFCHPQTGYFHALITARCAIGHPSGRGVIAHARSHDLIDWEVLPPLTQPGEFGDLEVPSLFKIKNRYYLLFSVLSTSHSQARLLRLGEEPVTGIHYMVADDLLGIFNLTTDKFLLGDPTDPMGLLYCGKTVQDRSGQWWFLACRLSYADNNFVGELINPISLSVDHQGNLILQR